MRQFVDHQRDERDGADHGHDVMNDEANQSSCCPLSRTICSAPMPTVEHADAPVVDLLHFALQVRRIEDEQLGHDDRRDADRDIDVEHPAPAVAVGQPAAEHRSEDRRGHDAEPPEAHGLAALVRREGFEQHRLRQRLQRAAGRPLDDAEDNQRSQSVGARPHRNDATVKPTTEPISSRFRPKTLASQPVIGRMMALATR